MIPQLDLAELPLAKCMIKLVEIIDVCKSCNFSHDLNPPLLILLIAEI